MRYLVTWNYYWLWQSELFLISGSNQTCESTVWPKWLWRSLCWGRKDHLLERELDSSQLGASSDSVNSKGVSDSLPSLSFFFFSFPLSNHAYFFSFLPFLFPNLLVHLCEWSKYFLMLSFKAGFHWFCGKTANFSPTSIFSFLPMFYLSTWLFCKRLHLPTSPQLSLAELCPVGLEWKCMCNSRSRHGRCVLSLQPSFSIPLPDMWI